MSTLRTPSWANPCGWENWKVRVWLAPEPAMGPDPVALGCAVGGAPAWVSEKLLSAMVRVADRGVTEGFGVAVQVMVLPVVTRVSQAGWPETVQVV